MKINKKHIEQKFEEVIRHAGFMLIDLEIRGNDKNPVLEVFIDNEIGVDADNCSFISNKLNSLIESENLIESDYKLIVSSPGVERPLKYPAQYIKHINRKFQVKYTEVDEKREFTGVLRRVDGEILAFEIDRVEKILASDQIITAKVVLSF